MPVDPRHEQPMPSEWGSLVGKTAFYRLIALSSPILGFPSGLVVGGIQLFQTSSPTPTPTTLIYQEPGEALVHRKTNLTFDASVGGHLTLAIKEVAVPERNVAYAMEEWFGECLAALGMVAIVTDDRVAHRVLSQDLVVPDAVPGADSVLDATKRVRNYIPDLEFTAAIRQTLESTPAEAVAGRGVTPRAIRWYLKGVQEGPNADGLILLLTALEACVFRFKEQNVGVRRAVKDRLEHFGAKWQGRDDAVDALFRFRNAVIHEGLETREELVENYYVAEHIVRTLLRRELLQSSEEGWPEDIHDAGVEYYSRERPEAHAYYRTLRAHFLLE